MRTMDDLHLISFIELQLKGKGGFANAYDVALASGLEKYLKKFVVVRPGDWPCQFYCRQTIYESLTLPTPKENIQELQAEARIESDHTYGTLSSNDISQDDNEHSNVPVPTIASVCEWNTHSVLRAQTKPSDTSEKPTNRAKSIFESKSRQDNFRPIFTPPKQFSFSQQQLQYLKVKCAQFLTNILTKIHSKPGSGSMTRKKKKKICMLT